jgi:hypothetical protein
VAVALPVGNAAQAAHRDAAHHVHATRRDATATRPGRGFGAITESGLSPKARPRAERSCASHGARR